ncbi:MAG: CRTAC1 family protein, partial [Acidobacteria bacterium]|nr:CRTAC1 family protein [Acidobacteriota bacterium]
YTAGLGLHTQYLGWGTMFFDFDNDGWPDLLLVNGHVYPEVDKYTLGSEYQEPRILYRNTGKGTFEDVSSQAGPAITRKASGRGLAIGDLWNNGKLSAVITNMGEAPSLLVNEMSYPNHWIAVRTIGTKSNRDGIGAKITIKAGGRVFVNEVRSGSSYSSSNDMRLHFGLGSAAKIDSLEVRWPTGAVESFDAKLDAINSIKEGTGKALKAAAAH